MTGSEEEWTGPPLGELAGLAPFDKPPAEYSSEERQAEMYQMVEDAGHPRRIERTQQELADRYGVSQPQISSDMQRIRAYEAAHNGTRAKAVTSWLAERAVMEAVENEEWREAFELQQEYVEYLFQTGDLEEEPDTLQIEGDPSEAYMNMLREVAADSD